MSWFMVPDPARYLEEVVCPRVDEDPSMVRDRSLALIEGFPGMDFAVMTLLGYAASEGVFAEYASRLEELSSRFADVGLADRYARRDGGAEVWAAVEGLYRSLDASSI